MGPFLFPWGAPHIDARPCIAHTTLTALWWRSMWRRWATMENPYFPWKNWLFNRDSGIPTIRLKNHRKTQIWAIEGMNHKNYPPEVWHSPWKVTFPVGKSFSNHHFSEPRLNSVDYKWELVAGLVAWLKVWRRNSSDFRGWQLQPN